MSSDEKTQQVNMHSRYQFAACVLILPALVEGRNGTIIRRYPRVTAGIAIVVFFGICALSALCSENEEEEEDTDGHSTRTTVENKDNTLLKPAIPTALQVSVWVTTLTS